jgi:hypothetical protein
LSLLALFSEQGDRRIEVKGQSKNDKNGRVHVDTTAFELAMGNVILIATAADPPKVKQLRRNLKDVSFEADALREFGRGDAEIVAFFGEPGQQ